VFLQKTGHHIESGEQSPLPAERRQ